MDIVSERARRGLSQKRLAMEAGLHVKTIRRIERGESVQPESVFQVCRVLGIDPRALADGAAQDGDGSERRDGDMSLEDAIAVIDRSDALRDAVVATVAVILSTGGSMFTLLAFVISLANGELLPILVALAAVVLVFREMIVSDENLANAQERIDQAEIAAARMIIEAVRRGEFEPSLRTHRRVCMALPDGVANNALRAARRRRAQARRSNGRPTTATDLLMRLRRKDTGAEPSTGGA